MRTRTLAALAAGIALAVGGGTAVAQDGNETGTVILDGSDRYETAALVTDYATVGSAVESLYIANGETVVDAVTTGVAASGSSAMLLVRQDEVPDATRDALGEIHHAYLVFVGGEDAISPAVREEVEALTCNYVATDCHS